MATVLVTGVGGAGGIGAIKALQEKTSHEIVGVDMDPAAAGLRLADEGCTVPPADEESWVNEMDSVIRRFNVDAVVPVVDEELHRLPALSSAVPTDVAIVAPRQDIIDMALDKWQTSIQLAATNHTVPDTWLATDADSIAPSRYPLQVKPRLGRGSRGAERLDSPADLDVYLAETDYARTELILQEFISGTEYTTSVVATTDNQLLEVVPKEVIEKDGSTVQGITRRNQAVSDSCHRLFDTLKPAGPINVQQIVDETNTPYTIEINPRFSSTACLTVGAGVNELDLLIRDAMGESITEPDGYEAGVSIHRYPDHVIVSQDDSHRRDQQRISL